jgi:hypothetical protein
MAFEKRCGPCGGHGYYGFNKEDICKVCGGKGDVALSGTKDDYKECGSCSGRGYDGLNQKDTCGKCKGFGVILRSSPIQQTFPSVEGKVTTASRSGTIFLVHGHNTNVRDSIHLYLTEELKLRVKVMAAEAHGGRTLPEKFEEIAKECSFAVFLMTADDRLLTHGGIEIRRARQNVVLEVGYFWGALGRRKHVAFLADRDLDLPTDIQGVGWIPITTDLGQTKLNLRKELEEAGLV